MSSMVQRSAFRLAAARSPLLVPLARPRLLSTLVLQRAFPKPPVVDTRWRGIRWNSTTKPEFIPESTPIPDVPIETLSLENVANVVAVIPPLQKGDLAAMGFCNYTPAGMIQSSMEMIHLSTGLPWFWTLVAGAVFWRVVLFPFVIMGTQNASRMKSIQPQMAELTAQGMASRQAGDIAGMQRVMGQAAELRRSVGVTPMSMFLPALVQLPVGLGTFFGMKAMCELPVLQLTQSGFALLPDLTQAGQPPFVLPIILAALGNVMIRITMLDADLSNPAVGHMMNGLRVLTFTAIPFMNHLPAGLFVTLITTSALTIVQMLVLRIPAVRRFFGLHALVPGQTVKSPSLRDSIAYVFRRR